ncbi:MAG: TonB-dependent receptor, partial [Alteromonas sp.]|nr:TonB-dependent receptor [Alteromonas sp.]
QHQVNNIAFYVQDEHELTDKLTLNVGLRFDHNKLEGGKGLSQLSPKASLVYSPIAILSLRFLAGRAFRAPSVSERYFKREISGGTEFEPNPDLNAEKVTSLEIGSRLRVGNWADIDAALFRSTYDDMLYWINIGVERGLADILMQVQNLNKAQLQGFETSVNFYPNRLIHLKLNYTYLDSKDLSPENEGTALAYKVKHTFSFTSSLR